MNRTNRFAKGSGMYACRCCKRNTRSTGNGDNENVFLCEGCFEVAGYENAVQDGHSISAPELRALHSTVEHIKSKGGRTDWISAELLALIAGAL